MIDLEQIEHDIKLAKSPNIKSWLLPIDTIEQMLALIRKQELALKESQELVAAQVRTIDAIPEAAAPAVAVVTVDTPEVRCYLMIDGNDHETNGIDQFSGGRTGGIPLVALPDALAHTAQAVAIEQAAHHATCERYIAERESYRRERDEQTMRAEKAEAAAPQQHAQAAQPLVSGAMQAMADAGLSVSVSGEKVQPRGATGHAQAALSDEQRADIETAARALEYHDNKFAAERLRAIVASPQTAIEPRVTVEMVQAQLSIALDIIENMQRKPAAAPSAPAAKPPMRKVHSAGL